MIWLSGKGLSVSSAVGPMFACCLNSQAGCLVGCLAVGERFRGCETYTRRQKDRLPVCQSYELRCQRRLRRYG